MKKHLSLALAILMLLSTISLASCGLIGNIATTAPEKHVRTTINEVEWLKVLHYTNYTLTVNPAINTEPTFVVMAADTKICIDIENGLTVIADLTTGLRIEENENGYIAEKLTVDVDLTMAYYAYTFFGDIEFADLTYDENTQTYVGKGQNAICEYRFEDGMLVHVSFVSADQTSEDRYSGEITNIGTTDFEIPEYTIVANSPTVTEEQWNANLNSTNYTIEANIYFEDHNGEEVETDGAYLCMQISPNASYEYRTYNAETLNDVYYTLINDVWYQVVYNNETMRFEGRALYYDASQDTIGTEICIDLQYSDFVFDSSLGAYVWTYSKITSDCSISNSLQLFFNNGVLDTILIIDRFTYSETEYEIDSYEIKVTNIGSTVVDVPEFVIVE